MRNTEELKSERTRLVNEGERLLDTADQAGRAMTSGELDRMDQITARLEAINAEIGTADAPRTPRPQPSNRLSDATEGFNEPRSRIAMPASGIKLQAYANTRQGREQAHTAGRFLAATFLRHGPSMRWCEDNGVRFDPMAALAGGINTAGGALVPDEMGRTIIELIETYGAFRANAGQLTMSSDSLTVARRTGGLVASYVAENDAGTESDASWDNVAFVAKKLMVLTRMSSEVSEDAIVDLGDKMTQEIALAFALKEDSVGFNGTGSASDGGQTGVLVKAIDGNHALAKVTASGSANSCDVLSEITADHLIDMMAAVPTYAKPGAKWYTSPAGLALVFNAISISASGNSMQNLANAPAPTFLGYPIVVSPVFPDNPATDLSGLVMLAFGNLALAATVATRRDIRVSISDQRYFELDQIAIKGTLRHSIVAHDLGSASIKSPFCVLVGN